MKDNHQNPKQAKRNNAGSVRTGAPFTGRWLVQAGLLTITTISTCLTPSCRRDETPTTASSRPAGGRTHWFEEIAASAGVNFQVVPYSVQRFHFPEMMSSGVALFDYDGDGFLDIYFGQGGDLTGAISDRPGNKLFRNRGDGTFEDVTAAAGVGDTGYAMGCACGDYDADGDVDLYVTNLGPNVLFRNNADGTFTDVTEAAV